MCHKVRKTEIDLIQGTSASPDLKLLRSSQGKGEYQLTGPSLIGKIYIDLTDLVINAIWEGTNTGIQRVQLNLAEKFIRSQDAIAFSVYNGVFVDLNATLRACEYNGDRFVARIRDDYRYMVDELAFRDRHPRIGFAQRAWRRLQRVNTDHRTIRQAKRQLKRGDVVVVMGAFWQLPSLLTFYEAIAKHGATLIGILHDLRIFHPRLGDTRGAKFFKQFLQLPIYLISVSQYTQSELRLTAQKGIASQGYTDAGVVQLAHEFSGAARIKETSKETAGIYAKPYVLFVSSIDKHKNHEMLISIWNEMAVEYGTGFPRLILAGKCKGKRAEALVSPQNLSPNIQFIRRPSDDELTELYQKCLFTVFPSLFEGWGLPVGESLWFGKACAASNATSIPEVGLDLCVYFNPNDRADFKRAIGELLNPQKRADDERRIATAPLRSWADVAAEMEAKIIAYAALPRHPRTADTT